MACRPFEGPLRQKKLFKSKNRWVRLYRGTLSIASKRVDQDDETVLTKKTLYHHLDLAEILDGKTPNPYRLKIRLQNKGILNFRIPVKAGPNFRTEWIHALRCHIAYANRCIGIFGSDPGSGTVALTQLAKESNDRVRSLEESLKHFNLALRNIQPRLLNSDVTQNLQSVTGSSEKAYRILKDFCDALLQENQKREEELAAERERARLAEEAIEKVTQKYNGLLLNVERRSVDTRSTKTSSEYFTPEGSMRGFQDPIENGGPNYAGPLTAAYVRSQSFRPEDVDKIQSAAQRRNIPAPVLPRIASYGPMSIDGSSYHDAISNGYATSSSDIFQDCISVDSRSFIVSNGHAISNTPVTDENSRSYSEVQSFKSARSRNSRPDSDAQSFKSAVSVLRV